MFDFRWTALVPSMPNIKLREKGVLKPLSNQDPHKSAGPDNIPSYMLKAYAKKLASISTIIYQASIDQSTIPNGRKTANVTQIFKKGDRSNPGY